MYLNSTPRHDDDEELSNRNKLLHNIIKWGEWFSMCSVIAYVREMFLKLPETRRRIALLAASLLTSVSVRYSDRISAKGQ